MMGMRQERKARIQACLHELVACARAVMAEPGDALYRGKGLVKGRAFDAAVKSFWYSRRKAGSSLCNPTKNMGSLHNGNYAAQCSRWIQKQNEGLAEFNLT